MKSDGIFRMNFSCNHESLVFAPVLFMPLQQSWDFDLQSRSLPLVTGLLTLIQCVHMIIQLNDSSGACISVMSSRGFGPCTFLFRTALHIPAVCICHFLQLCAFNKSLPSLSISVPHLSSPQLWEGQYVWHVVHKQLRNAYKISAGKPKGNRTLGRDVP
jgi:hypothetical protein